MNKNNHDENYFLSEIQPVMTQAGAVMPFLSLLLMLLAVLAPRAMAGGLLVYTLCALVAFSPRLSGLRINWRALVLPLLAFGWLALSARWSDSPRRSEMLRDTSYVLACGTVLLLTLPVWPTAVLRRTLIWALVALAFAVIFFAIQYALDFPITRAVDHLPAIDDLRTTNIPKRTACAIALLLWPAALWLRQRRWPWLIYPVMLAVTALLFFFSSRAAMLGGFAALFVFILSRLRWRAGPLIGFLLLPLGIPLALLAAAILPQLVDLQGIANSGEARLEIWQVVFSHFIDSLPLGIGFDGSRVIDPIVQNHPHNVYLQIALEGGIVGIALVMFALFRLWQYLCDLPLKIQPFVWAYVTVAVATLSIAYGAWQGWWLGLHFWAIFMLALTSRTKETSAYDYDLT